MSLLLRLAAAALLLPLLLSPREAPAADGGGSARPPAAPERAVVRATWKELPLAGVRLAFRPLPLSGGGRAVAAVTDSSGSASVPLPPGRYLLTARWRTAAPAGTEPAPESPLPAPGERFAWYGGNPVTIPPGGGAELVLPLVEVPPPPPPPGEPFPGSGVRGVVTLDGAPLRDAVVSAYPSADGAFREQPHAVAPPAGEDGAFALDLPPGDWFLVARKRAGGGAAGPLRAGDAFAYLPANPLRVEPGTWASAALPATVRRRGSSAGPAVREVASVSGRITGRDGRPRRGLHAGLHERADRFGRPLHLSDPTGADGRYRIPLPAGGVFFLGARSGYGGSPGPGDLQGRRDGPDNGAFTLRPGDRLEGIDIVVDEVW